MNKLLISALLFASMSVNAEVANWELRWTPPETREDGSAMVKNEIQKYIIKIYQENEQIPYKQLEASGDSENLKIGNLLAGKNIIEIYVVDNFDLVGVPVQINRNIPGDIPSAVSDIKLKAVVTIEVGVNE